jgi:catechol 2,3-dioxygenase-like lactoylglutathione lyase family enzyme
MTAGAGVTELEHVLVLSADIERARRFYETALGLRVGPRPPLEFPGYWLYAGQTPCLHIADRDAYRAHARGLGLGVDEQADGRGPVDHIAFGATDYELTNLRLSACGVEPIRNDVPADGLRQLFFDDPDGVRIEINVRAESPA